ncbi:MAG: polysaccharide biosynthesis protein PslG, partial [Frankiaceae bacterium]|nr:polysaccharide biosynthesis protein PslG [Frankiaceae bacterium]
MSLRLRSSLVALCATIVLGVLAGPAAAAPVLGVNLSGVPNDTQVAEAIATGAKDARMFVLWRDIEPRAKGTLDTYAVGVYAGIVKRLAAAGIHTTLVVTQSPQWASGVTNPNTPPRSLPDFADFIGRFAASDGLKGQGIAYEIWNEEDAQEWWGPAPDPAAYASLFKGAASALRTADPTAKVILGPLTGNDYGFVAKLYDNGIKGTFDAASVHTDTGCLLNGPSVVYREDGRIGRYSFLGYREVHKTMLDNSDDKPIWISEFGWSSSQSDTEHPQCQRGASANIKPSGVTEADQATFLTQAYHCASADPYLQLMDWFTARDASAAEAFNFDELEHYGLLRTNSTKKPSWSAFNTLATSGDPLTAPCGDFAGPSIKILTPQVGESYSDKLLIRAQASDPGGIGRITFQADGKQIRNFTAENDKPVEIEWTGARDLNIGPHTIQVIALDKQGNQQQAEVQVR